MPSRDPMALKAPLEKGSESPPCAPMWSSVDPGGTPWHKTEQRVPLDVVDPIWVTTPDAPTRCLSLRADNKGRQEAALLMRLDIGGPLTVRLPVTGNGFQGHRDARREINHISSYTPSLGHKTVVYIRND